MNKESPYISVIIPAYNESRFIGLCLESIKNQTYNKERIEIIVVDNGSKDNTVEIARRYTDKIFVVPNVTVAALRNFGAGKASGEILAFIDADCVAEPEWLERAVYRLNETICITGSQYALKDSPSWIERAWFSQRHSGVRKVNYINSGNLIVPYDIFMKIGGFNESLHTGEDYEFCMRARRYVDIISDDSIRVVHLGNPKTLRQFLRREIWHGLGAFGSLKFNIFDKPLMGTLIFLLLSLLQVFGLINLSTRPYIFFLSSTGLIVLLLLTVLYRRRFLKDLRHFMELLLLYYFYYMGRALSLFYLLSGKKSLIQHK